MYVSTLILRNTGPIADLALEFQFSESGPRPTVFVGQNGSGKSVALSYLVNTLLAARQSVFDDSEVGPGKVYKYRSPTYIRTGANYNYGRVVLENDFELYEWQLDRTQKEFSAEKNPNLPDESWSKIPEHDHTLFDHNFGNRLPELRKILRQKCLLYFPPNRFEEPAWLNQDDLRMRTQFSELNRLTRHSNRQVIQYAPLVGIKDWILDVCFDMLASELKTSNVAMDTGEEVPVFQGYIGPSAGLYKNILEVLQTVLDASEGIGLNFGGRFRRDITITGPSGIKLPNLFQLSTGESLLLNLGLAILRDFDRCISDSRRLEDVQGVVIVDEIDLHLHADYQFGVLPRLIRRFPKVQFILTSHSPLFLMGLRRELGDEGFDVVSMPTGEKIDVERFAEFEVAYDIFRNTIAFEKDIRKAVFDATRPAVFMEGGIDIRYIRHACKLANRETLLDSIELFDGDGYGNLGKVWKQLDSPLADALPRPVVLVFDCDRKMSDMDRGLVRRRGIPFYSENPIQNGIENCFTVSTLERARQVSGRFFDITEAHVKLLKGVEVREKERWEVNHDEKAALCEWMIENGTREDFEGIISIIDIVERAIRER